MLPVARVRMKSRSRDHFSACGESTTHALTYSPVPFRSLRRLPRLSIMDKEAITGITCPAYGEAVVKAMGTKGHPLFWTETKDVDLFMALFKDMNITDIFDLTPGSTAAACAATALGIKYEGIAISEKHANWMNNIMDKTIFAIIADATNDLFEKELRAEVGFLFGNLVEEGRQWMAHDAAVESDEEPGDSQDGEPGGSDSS